MYRCHAIVLFSNIILCVELSEVLENTLLLQLKVNYKQEGVYSLIKCLSSIIIYIHGYIFVQKHEEM